jgi:hypothetical protein
MYLENKFKKNKSNYSFNSDKVETDTKYIFLDILNL